MPVYNADSVMALVRMLLTNGLVSTLPERPSAPEVAAAEDETASEDTSDDPTNCGHEAWWSGCVVGSRDGTLHCRPLPRPTHTERAHRPTTSMTPMGGSPDAA